MDIGFTLYPSRDVIGRMDEWNTKNTAGRVGGAGRVPAGRWLGTIAPDAGCLPADQQRFWQSQGKADSLHSSVGLWSSPWADTTSRDIRVSHAKEYGFETVDGKLALSGPNYFKNFNDQIIS